MSEKTSLEVSQGSLQLSTEIMMFSIFDELQSTFNEQVCVGGHHVATSDNAILHLKILFRIVAPRVLLLCETKFSLKGEGQKVHV